ncbi:hypothetical protein ES703_24158 [subsurface metagenome]
MNNIKSFSFLTCAATYLLAGCANQQQFKAVEQICLPDTPKAEAMHIAEDVLGKMHFTIDKADADQGLIRTRPLPGPQFFEFWRSDHSAEANLHSIRRIVELNISQQAEKLCIGCDVKVQRLSLPELRGTGHEVRGTGSIQKLNLSPEQKKDMAWLDLGKDTRLATEILKRIEKRIVTQGP